MPTNMETLCNNFASTLGGGVLMVEGGQCSVAVTREDLTPTIMDIPVSVGHSFVLKRVRNASLVIGDLVLLQREVPYIVRELSEREIVVSAVHNHWLFDRPRLMYVHFQTRMDSLEFAKVMADILRQMPEHC